jgi:hypothetical protein
MIHFKAMILRIYCYYCIIIILVRRIAFTRGCRYNEVRDDDVARFLQKDGMVEQKHTGEDTKTHTEFAAVASSQVRRRQLTNNKNSRTFTSSDDRMQCGALDPSSEMMDESSRIVQKWLESPNDRPTDTTRSEGIINVDTYFHIVYSDVNYRTGKNETVGLLSNSDVTNQLQVLNDSFRPYGFTFTLIGTTRSNNSEWYYNNTIAMKSVLHVGNASTLNVYFTDAYGLAGFAEFPWDYALRPQNDGVVINSIAIPGGAVIRRNQGKTLVHEVGHWLGLLHPFQIRPTINSVTSSPNTLVYQIRHCLLNDDMVSDTPRQASPTDGCPERRNSCWFYRGLDPIHNFMDYSNDTCLYEFTNGQMNRMKAMWYEYRSV